MTDEGIQIRGEKFASYVSGNSEAIHQLIEQYPQKQRLARYLYIFRLATKERDEKIGHAARQALAPLIVRDLKEGKNTALYRSFVQQCFEQGVDSVQLDVEWAAAKDRQSSADLEKLQVALGQAQSNLSKEGIRTSLMQIAEHYFARGDLVNAIKSLARARDVCTSPEQIALHCTLAVQFSCFHENGVNLPSAAPYVQRFEQVAEALDVVEFARARVASGLVQLDRKQYRNAAIAFSGLRSLATNTKITTTLDFAAVTEPFMRASDLALITAITALACFERAGLDAFISNPDFKVLFETEPELRNAVNAFYECQYYQSLSILNSLEKRMRLDLYLSPHAGILLNQVRQRAIKQYVSPFVTVDLNRMAAVFQTNLKDLESELADMIVRGTIAVRIDKARGALQAMHSEPTQQAVIKAAALGSSFVLDTEMALRTLSMQRNGVFVQPPAFSMKDRPTSASGGAAAIPYGI